MAANFDVVVIGTGTAATTAATSCRKAGWSVAVVDSRPFGGTCALRGCDPKKVLVGAGEVIDWSARMAGKGLKNNGLRIDWTELIRFKRSFTEPVPKEREESFAKAGISAYHGRARFTGPKTIQIGDSVLEGRHVVIAAGARPATLHIPGEDLLTTSEQFLNLDALPANVVFVGGGYISFEFAHLAAHAGAKVVVLDRGERPLTGFDPDLVEILTERTEKLGIELQLQTIVKGIEQSSGSLLVHASSSKGNRVFKADMVVHGGGRVPEIDDLGLEAAGVKWDARRGVTVNEYLQSVSNPAVYSAGDAAASGGLPLTPVAGYEAQIVSDNLIKGNHAKPNYRGIPTVVYTTPQLAAVGLSEMAARDQSLRFRTNYSRTSGWYSSRRVGEEYSGFKVLIEESSDRILGAHWLGPEASELINIFALAVRSGLPASALRDAIFAYPTYGSDIPYML